MYQTPSTIFFIPTYPRVSLVSPTTFKQIGFVVPVTFGTQQKKAKAKDLAFVMTRENETPKCTWTSFNKKHSTIHTEKTTTGYLPIIQAPANDLDTLNTVVLRILHIAQSLGQKVLVLTVDEGLFSKLMELKWSVLEYKGILIPRLGGLHTAMNFQGCLGQHMQDSGLGEIWTESGLLGDNSVQ